jgi:hypothetical protein
MDENIDKEYIAAYGASFPKEIGDIMFGMGDDLK